MPKRNPEMPHTQTSAPVEPPETTEDPVRRRDPDDGRASRRADEEMGREERMPRGADEPGAGM
jgi:hypothetical protein